MNEEKKVKDNLEFDSADFNSFNMVFSKKVKNKEAFQDFINYSHQFISKTAITPDKIRMAIVRNNEFSIIIGMRAVLSYTEKNGGAKVGFIVEKEQQNRLFNSSEIIETFDFKGGSERVFVLTNYSDFNVKKEEILSHTSKIFAEEYESIKNTKLAKWNEEASTTNLTFKHVVFNNKEVEKFVKMNHEFSDEINYFKLQIRNGETETTHAEEVIADNRITTGSEHGKGFIELVKPKDIVMVHKGNKPYCLAQVIRKMNSDEEMAGVSFGNDYKVDVLSFFKDVKNNRNIFPEDYKTGPNGTFTPLNTDSDTLTIVKKWYHFATNSNPMEDNKIITLLKHKKQIILQGPPGTGKTRMAKEIAQEMIQTKLEIYPMDKIDDFFKGNYVSPNPIDINSFENKLNEFYEAFPKESLNDITLSEYSIGNGQNDSFCWWIERGLQHHGYYSPGNSTSYLIYWSKSKDCFSIHGKNLKDKTEEEALKILREKLHELVNKKNYKENIGMFGESFMLKILNSYYPKEYFPINSDKCLTNLLKILNKPNKGLNRLEKNLEIQKLFESKSNEYNSTASSYEFMLFLFDTFNLKGEVKMEDSKIVNTGEYKTIQFHPSYTYEDFVRGITVKSHGDSVSYVTENKTISTMASEALNNKNTNYVLIIDEINRANLSSVLGELIYALEYRYYFNDTEKKQKEAEVESMYDLANSEDEDKTDKEIILPENLYIIGTMNTADRSVGQIDYAIRRRFAFVDVLPKELTQEDMEEGLVFNTAVFNEVAELFDENKEYLNSEFKANDVQLGHSYFIHKTNEFNMKLEYEIKPILREYVADGILNENALEKIKKLNSGVVESLAIK